MKRLPSRLRRLDGALADLAVEEPMLLTELDGFLTGLVVCPEAIPQTEWMTVVWGAENSDVPPFEDPLDVHWFASAVLARRDIRFHDRPLALALERHFRVSGGGPSANPTGRPRSQSEARADKEGFQSDTIRPFAPPHPA